jgi:hypothetical protein
MRLKIFFSTASINTLICPVGGILSATILDQLGRKYTRKFLNKKTVIFLFEIFFFCYSRYHQHIFHNFVELDVLLVDN